MKKSNSFYDIIDQIVSHGVDKGILHLHNEDEYFSGNSISLKGNKVVNFGSCSYLGLEFDHRLKEGAKLAIDHYGTQFSESRAYVSLGLYDELESLFQQIFEHYCVVTPTTSLGHIANIPVLVSDEDAVIMDHQVHNSVQTAVSLLKPRGIHVELLRHNRMDMLEDRIKHLRSRHKKIWYMADGVYSMYGDGCPLAELHALMNNYPEFYSYIDDAHGMSIYGKHGRGYTLSKMELHPKMAMATSLAKGFATGGAVLVYPNYELARKVRTCGGPLITSGPLQPATLGAAVASAKIHLSDEIYDMQESLHDKVKYAALQLKKYNLPVVSHPNGCIFFVGTSLPKLGYNMVKRLLNKGHYVNLGIFPAVPIKNTGIRFTITRLHSFSQIEEMIATMAAEFPKALKEEGMTFSDIYKAFKLPMPEELMLDKTVDVMLKQTLQLKLHHHKSIEEVDKKEWNQLFENKGTFDWEGVKTLEDAFTGNELPEDNWTFDYLLVKDNEGKPVVATFLTTSLWKEDMLSPALVSEQVEEVRKLKNPYYLTNKVTSTGSLLTEGEHVYIDKTVPVWKEAMQLLFEKVNTLQESYKANSIVVRDFHCVDEEFDNFMVDNGFYKVSMPDTHIVDNLITWNNKDEFYEILSKRSRQHFREDIRKHENKYIIKVITEDAREEDINYWYELYLNVKEHSLELNTFTLPLKLFKQLFLNNKWEALTLTLKPGFAPYSSEKPVCVVLNYKSSAAFMPMIIGIDYTHNKDFKIYRQALFQLLMRAKALGKNKVFFGFAAGIEKKKLGAKVKSTYAFMQSKDTFNSEVLMGVGKHSSNIELTVK
jgi:7-keto-8-aminopelargonate synthetase-like enzyme/predicted N-acyltransferase